MQARMCGEQTCPSVQEFPKDGEKQPFPYLPLQGINPAGQFWIALLKFGRDSAADKCRLLDTETRKMKQEMKNLDMYLPHP